jgi:hypothetical protein
MLGVYEHKRWFRYVPVLEVREEGIWFRRHIYTWDTIENVRRHRSHGSAGYGTVLFSDGAKCCVNLRTFRKKGEKCRVSFLGENTTFDALNTYILQQNLESLKDPRIRHLENEIDKLEEALRESDGNENLTAMERRLMAAIDEKLRLDNLYHETVTERIKIWG